MKSDAQLKRDVEEELDWDPAVPSAAIGVSVGNGVVTLTGHVATQAEKHAAADAVRRVIGVQAIAVELDAVLSPEHRRNDIEIAVAIEQVLTANTAVPSGRIRVAVDKGWITLEGEVDWDYQRRAAEKAIRPLAGVVGISNELTIKPRVMPSDLQNRILGSFKRQAEREARHIDIQVNGTSVTLRCQVHSWKERDAAQGVVWSAPGVRTVLNELTVD